MRRLISRPINIRRVIFGAVVVCVFGTVANGAPWDGSGTAEDPYKIWDACDMQAIGADANYWDAHFKLMADVDLSAYTGTSFNIIGNETNPFMGVLDGNEHDIHNFIYVTTEETQYVGLFGHINASGAKIRDLHLLNPFVDASECTYVAALAGRLYEGTIDSCKVSDGIVVGRQYVGCIAGDNRFGLIELCSASGQVTGSLRFIGVLVGENWEGNILNSNSAGSAVGGVIPVTSFQYIGGLAGENLQGVVSGCYSTASVTGHGIFAGGLLGSNWSIVEDSYALGDASADEAVGGLVGYNTGSQGRIDRCYSAGQASGSNHTGGLVGFDEVNSVNVCFWDVETSDCNTSDGGTGLPTAQMQDVNTFILAGWDFIGESANGTESIWRLCNYGAEYPQLNWQFPLGDIICPDGVEWNDLGALCEQWLLKEIPADVWPDGGDRIVNFFDWAVFAAGWESTPDIDELAIFVEQWLQRGVSFADIAPAGGDGIVNMLDFAVLANNWLAGL